jgi:hypothetical protein
MHCFKFLQDIWDHSGQERKGEIPGSPDDYRETVYDRDYNDHSFDVLQSLVETRRRSIDTAV